MIQLSGRSIWLAFHDGLLEQAELVINPVAERRVIKRRQRIEEAGGETTEAAVAETHVALGLADLLEVLAERGERSPRGLIEPGRDQVVAEQPAHEVFEREIVDAADVMRVVHRLGRDHARVQLLAHGHHGGDPPVARGGRAGVARQRRDVRLRTIERPEDRRPGHRWPGAAGAGAGGKRRPCPWRRPGRAWLARGARVAVFLALEAARMEKLRSTIINRASVRRAVTLNLSVPRPEGDQTVTFGSAGPARHG